MSHVAANKNPAGRKGPSSPNPQSQRPDTKGQQANKQPANPPKKGGPVSSPTPGAGTNGTPKENLNLSNVNANAPKEGQASPRESTPSTSSALPAEFDNQFMYERTLWLSMNLVGKLVEVQVKSGETYEGYFHTASTDRGYGVVLKFARKKDSDPSKTRPVETFVINPQDFLQLVAKDVSFESHSTREFATDTDISGHGTVRERELQPWMPDTGEDDGGIESLSLDRGRANWDQFAVNEQLYGVKTTWDEKYYTTPLDRGSVEYRKKVRQAERLAEEIERGAASSSYSNIHLAEERGQEVDMDEEELYGAVIREPKTEGKAGSPSAGKYVPPGRRTKQDETKPAAGTSTQQPASAAMSIPAGGHKKEEPQPSGSPAATSPVPGSSPSGGVVERTSSVEDLNRRLSPRGSGSPLTAPGDIQTLVQERLKIRATLVNERLKNSAPVPSKGETDFAPNANRSPLLSPLVGDPKSINALSLEPSTPKVPEDVVKQFFDFSLQSKKQQQQQQQHTPTPTSTDTADAASAASAPSTATGGPAAAAGGSPSNALPAVERERRIAEWKTFSASLEPKVKPKQNDIGALTKDISVPGNTSATTGTKSQSKLNPKAKEFKPMSANAPSFTPSGTVSAAAPVFTPGAPVVPAPVPPEYFVPRPFGQEDPYFYGPAGPRAPMYPPYVGPQMVPAQMYPPVRVPAPGVAPFPYPNPPSPQFAQFGQPVVYAQPPSPGTPPQSKRFVPPVPPGGKGVPPPQFAFVPGPRGLVPAPGQPFVYAGPYGAPPPGQPIDSFSPHRHAGPHGAYYPPQDAEQQPSSPTKGAEEPTSPVKFQGVPNTDSIPTPNSPNQQ